MVTQIKIRQSQQLHPFTPLIPKIWLLILPSLCFVSFKISYKNLALDQDYNFHLISLSILITSLLDNVWLL